MPAPMAGALARRGVTEPFPIQAATIPDALAGRDVCGRAPTGSGKTIAFGIPLVMRVGKAKPRRPRGLVLVPTRELASQVAHELQQLAKPKGPWVEAFYGGVGFPRQVQALQRGVDIAVACPGRLADLINQGCADLRDVDFIVVDEADRMADMGFLPEVRRLLDQCAGDRQTLLFSATLDGDVDVLINRYQRDPLRHELYHDDEDASRATHLFWSVDRAERITVAADVVKRSGPTIVFCRTKRGADRVARQLETKGVPAAAIHGDRSQGQRERALRSFHRGEVAALVATDVAARGIHVDDVACVIHFDPPADPKDYVHRSGRTARAGASGLVVTLVLPDLRKPVKQLQKELGHPIGLDAVELAKVTPVPENIAQEHVAQEHVEAHSTRTPTRPPKPGREPLPDGKRRPSGAARRKAKRLATLELDEEPDTRAGAPKKKRRSPATPGGTRTPKGSAARHGRKPARPKAGRPAPSKSTTKQSSRKSANGKPANTKRAGRKAATRRSARA
ncbi:MAG: DEAD/DEAH box helicase [Actinobacteria bacterium]|nr:DEAD/DEAH box helicase [Actinomycetota bacterium]